MSDTKDVAKDITIALINRISDKYIGTTEDLALYGQEVAELYKTIYKAVLNPKD
jgi:hypothetical protein